MSNFYNTNKCHSFNINVSTNITPLSSFRASEVVILNNSGQNVFIIDYVKDTSDESRMFLLKDTESMIFRGITNSGDLSAKTDTGAGTIYCRTAMFSNLNQ